MTTILCNIQGGAWPEIYKVEVKCLCVYIQSFYLLTQEFLKPCCKPVDIVETPLKVIRCQYWIFPSHSLIVMPLWRGGVDIVGGTSSGDVQRTSVVQVGGMWRLDESYVWIVGVPMFWECIYVSNPFVSVFCLLWVTRVVTWLYSLVAWFCGFRRSICYR